MIITRFAPSPTGMMHIGGARTALYSFLWARKNSGKFLLRIEDTDRKRFVSGAEENILESLKWLGLNYDDKVIKQSDRFEVYKKYVQRLIDLGHAYYCFCTPDRLKQMRDEQIKNKMAPKYDKKCLNLGLEDVKAKLKAGEKYVIRLKVPNEGAIEFTDLVRGRVIFECKNIDDQVLIKSDEFPTYHLANVVDDHDMGVNYVIRGEEWLPSTPKHIILYQAFGWEIPKFAHLSIFLKKGGGKMSKREGATSLLEFKKLGYLPEAIINFIAFLGWNPKDGREFFSLNELISEFDLKNVHKANPIFDYEKLDYLNGYYIRKKSIDELYELSLPYLKEAKLINEKTNINFVKNVIKLEQPRLKKLSDLSELVGYFFKKPDYSADLLVWKKIDAEITKKNLIKLLEFLNGINDTDFKIEILDRKIREFILKNNLKNGEVLWPMRAALSGREASPSPFEIASIFGKEQVVARINEAINKF